MAAIQLASRFGARVYCTAGKDAKCAACIEQGAEIAINYRTHDFEEVIAPRAGKVDVVLDMVGGGYFSRNMRLLGKRPGTPR